MHLGAEIQKDLFLDPKTNERPLSMSIDFFVEFK